MGSSGAGQAPPKKYGDKVEVEHQGNVGMNITRIERVIIGPTDTVPEITRLKKAR